MSARNRKTCLKSVSPTLPDPSATNTKSIGPSEQLTGGELVENADALLQTIERKTKLARRTFENIFKPLTKPVSMVSKKNNVETQRQR